MKLHESRKQLNDLRTMNVGQLADQLAELKKEQFNLRFQQATGQLQRSSRIREVRAMIARVQTVLREKRPPQTV